ncbi:MAG: hypothetical protein ACLFQQ_18810 [Desulfococcaceae bacterium]
MAQWEAREDGRSLRHVAREIGIPRSTLQRRLDRKDSIDAAPEVAAFFDHLLPGLCIEKVAEKKNRAEDRDSLRRKSRELLRPLREEDGRFRLLGPDEKNEIERIGEECVGPFQPSSCRVEGRKGQSALRRTAFTGSAKEN